MTKRKIKIIAEVAGWIANLVTAISLGRAGVPLWWVLLGSALVVNVVVYACVRLSLDWYSYRQLERRLAPLREAFIAQYRAQHPNFHGAFIFGRDGSVLILFDELSEIERSDKVNWQREGF